MKEDATHGASPTTPEDAGERSRFGQRDPSRRETDTDEVQQPIGDARDQDLGTRTGRSGRKADESMRRGDRHAGQPMPHTDR